MFKTNHNLTTQLQETKFESLSTKDKNFKTKILSTNEFTEI